jgi:curved DNA-binding protein CbpA
MGDPYEVLGVKREAALVEIKTAYKNLAKKLHPDKTGGNQRALEQMKLVNEAYAVLCSNLQRSGRSGSVEDNTKYNREVWEAYSKQVEEYYQQVQQYMEAQMALIKAEREKCVKIESDLKKKESGLEDARKAVESERRDYARLNEKEKDLKRREEYISKRESELDELMILISRSNSIVAEMVQSSKAMRKRTE